VNRLKCQRQAVSGKIAIIYSRYFAMQYLNRKHHFFLSYSSIPPWDTNISPAELVDFLDSQSAGRALDIGCGTGTNLITMAAEGWVVDGIEYIRKAVRAANQKVSGKNLPIQIYHADFLKWKCNPNTYDFILDMGCYHSLPEREKRTYENKVFSLLKVGGFYYLNGFLQNETPRRGIKPEDIAALSARFNLMKDVRNPGIDDRPAAWLLFRRD
jgi:SAM-dependent methyltransferase